MLKLAGRLSGKLKASFKTSWAAVLLIFDSCPLVRMIELNTKKKKTNFVIISIINEYEQKYFYPSRIIYVYYILLKLKPIKYVIFLKNF